MVALPPGNAKGVTVTSDPLRFTDAALAHAMRWEPDDRVPLPGAQSKGGAQDVIVTSDSLLWPVEVGLRFSTVRRTPMRALHGTIFRSQEPPL